MATQPYPQQPYPMDTYPGYREPPPLTRPPKKKTTYAAIAVLLVIVIVIGAVSIYWALLPRADVTVRIVNQRDSAAEYDLRMDGELLLHGYVRVNEFVLETFSIVLDSGGCEEHTFSAAIGGFGFRPMVYSETVTLCPGVETGLSLGD